MATTTAGSLLNKYLPATAEKPKGYEYIDVKAGLKVMNARQWLIILILVCVIAAQWAWMVKLLGAVGDLRPIVVRVNDKTGEAIATPYVSLQYQPREPEVQYFLSQFITLHYARQRATLEDSFKRKLLFMERPKAMAFIDENNRTKLVQKFLTGTDPEAEVEVKNILVENLQTQPYKASATFDIVYRSGPYGQELKRETYTSVFQFRFLDAEGKVDINMLKVNPLGLIVTYWHATQSWASKVGL